MKILIRRALEKKITVATFLMLLILGVFYFNYSFAQEAVGIPTDGVQASPVRFDWDLNDGDERTGVINLKNYSENEYLVTVELEDFYVSDDSSEARFFIPNANHPLFAYDVINWIEIPKEIKLAPKEGKDIFFKVKVPLGTPTGGYYGAIFFKTRAQEVGDGEVSTKVLINQRVGVLLIMAVKGDQPIRLSGELKEFKATRKIFWSQPAELQALIFNNGNLHFKALGKIDINKFGRKIWSKDIVPKVFYPGKLRELTESWDFSAWSFGFYRAKLELASEDQNIRLFGETTFWVIPWKTLLAIILLLAAIRLTYKLFSDKFEIRRKEDKTEISNS